MLDGIRLFSLMREAWAPLRKTPQFWALTEREGLMNYWHDSKHRPDFCNGEAVGQKYR